MALFIAIGNIISNSKIGKIIINYVNLLTNDGNNFITSDDLTFKVRE